MPSLPDEPEVDNSLAGEESKDSVACRTDYISASSTLVDDSDLAHILDRERSGPWYQDESASEETCLLGCCDPGKGARR
jgi:hypothetical protein